MHPVDVLADRAEPTPAEQAPRPLVLDEAVRVVTEREQGHRPVPVGVGVVGGELDHTVKILDGVNELVAPQMRYAVVEIGGGSRHLRRWSWFGLLQDAGTLLVCGLLVFAGSLVLTWVTSIDGFA